MLGIAFCSLNFGQGIIHTPEDEQARNQLRGLLVDTYLSTPKLHIPKVLPLFIGMVAPTMPQL